jgi:hypothetical protein
MNEECLTPGEKRLEGVEMSGMTTEEEGMAGRGEVVGGGGELGRGDEAISALEESRSAGTLLVVIGR